MFGRSGRVAEELSPLSRRDGWWIGFAALPALALFAWTVREPGSAPFESAVPLDGAAWFCGAVGYAGFGSFSVLLGLIDIRTLLLPNRLLAVMAIWVFVWSASAALLAGDWSRFGWALAAAVVGAVVFAVIWLRFRHSFGGGDVKLAPICMFVVAWADPTAALLVFPFAVAAASVPGLVLALRKRGAQLPYGPTLLAAVWLTFAFPSEWLF